MLKNWALVSKIYICYSALPLHIHTVKYTRPILKILAMCECIYLPYIKRINRMKRQQEWLLLIVKAGIARKYKDNTSFLPNVFCNVIYKTIRLTEVKVRPAHNMIRVNSSPYLHGDLWWVTVISVSICLTCILTVLIMPFSAAAAVKCTVKKTHCVLSVLQHLADRHS